MNNTNNNPTYCKEYYTTGNYNSYLSKGEKYYKLSCEIIGFFNSISLNKKDHKILDFGCAVGFLLDGFRKEGFQNLYGFDISDWATSVFSQKHNILDYKNVKKEKFDICFALDVFEHMTINEINDFFQKIDADILVFRIPVSNDGGTKFVLDVSNNDKTHINCKEKKQWVDIIKQNNYIFWLPLNLNSIYDSEGVLCGIAFKQGSVKL